MGRDPLDGRRPGRRRDRRSLISPAPKLVVFDCDGVLVDSEAIVIEVEAELLSSAGFELTADQIAERYVGLSYPDMMAGLQRDFGRPVPDGLSEEVQQAALDAFPGRLTTTRGMTAFLEALQLPRCVASSSALSRVELSLGITGLDQFFEPEHVFSSQMVERGKPAPDLFLLAANRLGFQPADCVVIEDSPHGVEAALAADMSVVGYVGGLHARPSLTERLSAAGATTIVDSPEAIAQLL
ncbi:MAG: HAD family hydrolase [Acidimicrobiales bacterium]